MLTQSHPRRSPPSATCIELPPGDINEPAVPGATYFLDKYADERAAAMTSSPARRRSRSRAPSS